MKASVVQDEVPAGTTQRVRWARVALFYGLAFGWVCLVAAGLYLTGHRDVSSGQGSMVVTTVLAVLYMPAPLVAALVVERLDGRPTRLRTLFSGFGRTLPKLVLVAVPVVAALILAMLGLTWILGNVLDLSGPGRVLVSHDDLVANALLLVGSMDADQVASLSASLPGLWPLLGLAFLGALVAGFTINGAFALGEEYGWRGWLADELRPLGAFWANVLTGVLWGLWHAPLILMGFNYAGYGRIGTAFMIAFCVPMSFLLWRARQVTGSLLSPAILHGALNGFAGVFSVVLVDANPIAAAPVGVVGAAAAGVVALVFWVVTRKPAGRAG
ncbi:MAG: CPBP family intramembrane metalloprotease [Propionicimonas sp.]|uniref:CPBP family intramembrane glutamic endopeptidase n=1 Tax=Propionicimonas sp. TaxID=1955623 RepID=UPI003D128C6D